MRSHVSMLLMTLIYSVCTVALLCRGAGVIRVRSKDSGNRSDT